MLVRAFTVSACVAALALVAAPAAQAQVYTNNAPITIPDDGPAAPYPSTINVTGFVGTPTGLRVRLKNVSHTFASDVAVLLVAPSGQGIELISRNIGSFVFGQTLTFGAESTTPLPRPLFTGVFAPAGGNTAFTAPANAIPRASSLAVLIAGNPNGQWRLFVEDLEFPDAGTIAGGWELEFSNFGSLATMPASPSTLTYQGRLEGGVTTGTIDARFSLWSHPSLNVAFNRLAAPVTVSGVAVTNGLFTTPVDLGVPVPADIKTWLQVEISSPAGEPFVTLTPRQPITATPLAGAAQRAVTADFATSAVTATSATNATNAATATNATNAQNVPWSGLTGQAAVTTGAIGTGWQMLFTNTTVGNFRGGMRLADNGFFEVTNNSNLALPNFARLAGNGAWTAVSDARLKTDITSAENNLAAAMQLRPVNFRWKSDGTEDFGLIAQEVREVLPRLVIGDQSTESLTVNYSQLSVVAIGAIQELKADNDRKQREIDALRARLDRIEEGLRTQPAIPKP